MNVSRALETARFLKEHHHDKGQVPNYENVLEAAYRHFLKPGDNVIDIGAHGGRHTRIFRDLIGDTGGIWAFEPLPHMAEHLRSSFASQSNVHVFEIALSDKVTNTVYKFVSNAPEESGLRERIYNIDDPIIQDINVNVSTADRILAAIDRIDYIKIDIEGGEIDCLKGMNSVLAKHQPFLSIEYGFPSYSKYDNTNMTLWDMAQQLGFHISDLFGNIVEDAEEWVEVCDHAYWDFFLVPIGRRSEWSAIFSSSNFPSDFSI